MPNVTTLNVQAGQLPSGFCPSDLQSMLNGFSAVQFVTLNLADGGTQIIPSSSKPTVTNVVWLQLDSLGRPIRYYWFAQGSWLSTHALVPGLIMPWIGNLPDFTAFDGGDAAGLSNSSGPMWEVVAELAGKFPVGAGALPSGESIKEGDVGGNDLQTKIQDHTHATGRFKSDGESITYLIESSTAAPTGLTGEANPGAGGATPGSKNEKPLDGQSGDWTGTSTVLNLPSPNTQTVLPPYRGINFIRRTQRLFYSVT